MRPGAREGFMTCERVFTSPDVDQSCSINHRGETPGDSLIDFLLTQEATTRDED